MKRFLLILACLSMLCCFLAIGVSAEEIDPNAEYYDKVYVDKNGREFPIYEKVGDTFYPLVWFAYDVTEVNEETGDTTVVETKYIKAHYEDCKTLSYEYGQGRFNGIEYTYVDEDGVTLELNTSHAIVLNLRGGVLKSYDKNGVWNGGTTAIKTIETTRYHNFNKLQAIYFPLTQTMVGGFASKKELRVCDFDKNHPIGVSFNHACLQWSSIEEIFIPAGSNFGNKSGGTNSQFKGCSKLKRVEFGGTFNDWLTGYLFDSCSSLEEIIIPLEAVISPNGSGVTLNNNAFAGCSALKRVYFMGDKDAIEAVVAGANSGNTNFTNMTRISYAEYSNLEDKTGGKYIIYDCSPCLAYNGDVHTPTDEQVLVGNDYFGEIKVACPCGADGCVATMTVSTIAPMFVDKGYAARTFGEGYAVIQSYSVNRAAIAEYEKYKAVEFGVVATVNASGVEITPDINDKNVYSAKLWDIKVNDYLDIIVNNIPDNSANVESGLEAVKNSDKSIVFCLYAKEGESTFFLDGGTTAKALTGISYQEILSRTEK